MTEEEKRLNEALERAREDRLHIQEEERLAQERQARLQAEKEERRRRMTPDEERLFRQETQNAVDTMTNGPRVEGPSPVVYDTESLTNLGQTSSSATSAPSSPVNTSSYPGHTSSYRTVSDPGQSAVNSINTGLNIQNQTIPQAPKADPVKRGPDREPQAPSKPQGGSDYVGTGVNMTFQNYDIAASAAASVATTRMQEGLNGYAGAHQITTKMARHADYDTYVNAMTNHGYSTHDLINLSQRVDTRCSKEVLDNLTSEISHDGQVINIVERNMGSLNGNSIVLSHEDAYALKHCADVRWQSAVSDDGMLTLDRSQIDAIQNFTDFKRTRTLERSSDMEMIKHLTSKEAFEELSPRKKQRVLSFADTVTEADGRYKTTWNAVDKARKELKDLKDKGASAEEIAAAKKKADDAEAFFKLIAKDAEGKWQGGRMIGHGSREGLKGVAFSTFNHLMRDDSGYDLTAKETQGTVGKARGAVSLAKQAPKAGRAVKSGALQLKADHLKKSGASADKVNDAVQRAKDYKDIVSAHRKRDLARIHGDKDGFKQATEELTEYKDNFRRTNRDIKNRKKDDRFADRRRRKGDTEKEISDKVRSRRQLREKNMNKGSLKERKKLEKNNRGAVRRAVKRRDAETAAKTAKDAEKKAFDKFVKRESKKAARKAAAKAGAKAAGTAATAGVTAGAGAGAAAAGAGAAGGAAAGAAGGGVVLIIIVIIILIIILGIVLSNIMTNVMYSIIGDDGEKTENSSDADYGSDYNELISAIRQEEIGFLTTVNNAATEAAIKKKDKIKEEIEKHIDLPNDFDVAIEQAQTGAFVDEYGNMRTAMGNYIPNIFMAKYRVNFDLKKDVNMGKVAEYVTYLWAGSDDSDSENWLGRHSDSDKVNDIGTTEDGKTFYQVNEYYYTLTGITDEETRDAAKYSYQNWDEEAERWTGNNHKVKDEPYTMEYRGDTSGNEQGVMTIDLNGDSEGWLSNDPTVSLSYWHHSNKNLSSCSAVSYHAESEGSPDPDCDNYHPEIRHRSEYVQTGWTDFEPKQPIGHIESVSYTVYVCDGHCPGHAVPVVDYQFIGNIENLCAFDTCPINDLTPKSLGERWTNFWKNGFSNLASFFSFGGKSNTVSEFFQGLSDALALKEEINDMSGESTWDHWNYDDVNTVLSMTGTYDTGYAEGDKMLKDMNIDVGSLSDTAWSADDILEFYDMAGVTFSDNPAEAEAQQKVVSWAIETCSKPYVGYSQDGDKRSASLDGRYYDCSSFAYVAVNKAGGSKMPLSTAAEEYKWCVQHNCAVSMSNLKPGDLVFAGGNSNGRYMGIHHVAVYIGNGLIAHASTGKPLNKQDQVLIAKFKPKNFQFAARPLSVK